ncbi:MAG: di/tricarboxylate transporter [Bradyrhizobium sp.]|jgi:di/tricarboxylate transporter
MASPDQLINKTLRLARSGLVGVVLKNPFKDRFFLLLFAVLVALSLFSPELIASYPALVDWPTIAALTGLLALTKGLELSSALDHAGHWVTARMTSERAVALCLVMAAALLSMVLTNDVALFVVVPLTLGVCRLTGMPLSRLVILEALAVNAGSALSPVGNPQNLFLWQLSGVSFNEFVVQMLPLVLMLMALLLVLTCMLFGRHPVKIGVGEQLAALDSRLFWCSLVLYAPFLLLTDLRHAQLAAMIVLLVFTLLRREVLTRIDWGLLLVFVLMFIDLRLLSGLTIVREAMQSFGLQQPRHLYLTAIAVSQLISNVPAAIALVDYSRDWRVIAYGVNVGGFSLMIGSMANLIALRMCGERKAWLEFHWYAIPFLGVAMAVGYLLLFM